MKNHIITILLLLNPFLFAYYEYGDIISIEDQLYPLNVCYGDYPDEILQLSDFNGDSNGGHYKVIVFRMTATWWGPSCAEAPSFDNLHYIFENDPVVIFENVDDLNQPYSCEGWGELGQNGIPILTYDEDNYYFWSLFGNEYTWSVVLGPDMVVKYSAAGAVSSNIVQNILDEYQILGDQNYDGSIDILDIIQLVSLILEGEYESVGDLNNDEILNIQDIILIVNIILNN